MAIITDALLLTAFILRVSGLVSSAENQDQLLLRSFQVLSFVSPFIWYVFDYFEAHVSQEPHLGRVRRSSPPHVFLVILMLYRTHYCVRWPQICWDYANMHFSNVPRVWHILCCMCSLECLFCSDLFLQLLSILGIGFLQGLYALDAADGQVESSSAVVHVMVQSLLQCVMQIPKS